MYLSKLLLNPRSREARRDLALPYELHRTLARAFSTAEGQDYRAAHNVLFRLEPTMPSQLPTVLVQSTNVPNWAALPLDYATTPVPCKSLELILTPGQVLGFRLLANPTRKVAREGRSQGRRVPLLDTTLDDAELTPAHQWLRRKAQLSGFEVLHAFSEAHSLNAAPAAPATGSSFAKRSLPLYGVRFDGLLRVLDPQLLTQALQQGVGPAKTFGCGLLSLARTT